MEISQDNQFQLLQELVEENQEGGEKAETPPPLIISASDESDWMKIEGILKKNCSAPYECQMKAKSIFVYTKNLKDYSKVNQVLIDQNIPHHTYRYECEKPIKAILKNIPASFTEEAIQQELNRRKYPVTKVKQFSRNQKGQSIKLPIYLLELRRNNKGNQIFNLNNMFSFPATIEKFNLKKRPIQCYHCQQYGHVLQ
ncbi:hypothetical protein X975_06309, partial [Stegodyphus mimosarum]